jgi:iron complex transport system substrate-binding protein
MKVQEARRIVSLTPSNTEILFALGLGQRVVGVTEYCDYPPEARKKAKVGDVNISAEKVLALKPDLIVAHRFLNARIIPTLQRMKLRILAADPHSFDELYAFMRQIGQVTGTMREAEQIIKQMQTEAQSVSQKIKRQRSRPGVLFMTGIEPAWVAGRGTFPDNLIRKAGGKNVMTVKTNGFQAISMEAVLKADPEVIILTGGDKTTLFNHPLWKRIPAIKNGRVYHVDANLFLRTGPRLIMALKELYQLLHEERG